MKMDLVEKSDVIDLIQNYYAAPWCLRKQLLDNIILAIKCMPSKDGDLNGS